MSPDQSCPSTSSLQSLSSSGSYSTQCRGQRQDKVVTDEEIPYGSMMLSRSPREIVEKKAEMEREGQTCVEEANDLETLDVEKEIQVKLFYLGMIHRLKEGRTFPKCGKVEEVVSLLMRIKDMEDKKEQALRLIWLEEEQEKLMKIQLEEARQNLTDLRMLVVSNKEVQVRTENLLQARLVTLQTELAQSKARYNKPAEPVMTGQATSCTTFSTLYSLAGQVDLLCMGEQGSKWVMGRLVEGKQEERSLVWKELNLPQYLTKHIANSNCRKVILVLAEVDGQARRELLRQTKVDLDTIMDMEGGQEFVTELLKRE